MLDYIRLSAYELARTFWFDLEKAVAGYFLNFHRSLILLTLNYSLKLNFERVFSIGVLLLRQGCLGLIGFKAIQV